MALIWGVCVAAAGVYWRLSLAPGHSAFRSLVKGLAVSPLVLLALAEGAPLVALALTLCSAGDVILSRPGARAFLFGLISFALGHLVWIAAFGARMGFDPTLLRTGTRGLALLAMAVLAVAMLRWLVPRAGALKRPVVTYIAIIIAMGVAALATPSVGLIAGAVLFMASDTLLGLQTFALTPGSPAERRANLLIWPLYWAAIALMTQATLMG